MTFDHQARGAEGQSASPRRLWGYRHHLFWAVLPVLLALYCSSGLYVVAADERAVVRRFGVVTAPIGPGMHFRLPWPVDKVDVFKTTSVMKIGVGFALPSSELDARSGMELLTGDTNILNAALVLHYVIRDPANFLLNIVDTPTFIEAIAEAVLTQTVIGMPIDEVLTRGRVAIQERVQTKTQEILDQRGSGVQVVSASIMSMTLDRSVAEAFQDVANAMADREKVINEARAYQSNLIPKARGQATTQISEAEAYRQHRLAQAVGETSHFLALKQEYEKAPDITRTRLYLEAMERILPRVQLYVIDSDKGRVPLHLRVTGP